MVLVQISENSWDEILKIQEEAYTELPAEDVNVLKSKWYASPETCFIYLNNENKILAYLLSHPWCSDNPPKLYEEVSVNKKTSSLYLHDLALSIEARGRGIAGVMVENLINKARTLSFTKIMLVAVQGSTSFWAKYGFMTIDNATVCTSYGNDAKLMILELNT